MMPFSAGTDNVGNCLQIQTNGTCSPLEALSTSVQDLEFEFQDIKEQFKVPH